MTLNLVRTKIFSAQKGCRAIIEFYLSENSKCGASCNHCSRREFALVREIKEFLGQNSTKKEGSKIIFQATNSYQLSKLDIKIHNLDLNAESSLVFKELIKNRLEHLHCKVSYSFSAFVSSILLPKLI